MERQHGGLKDRLLAGLLVLVYFGGGISLTVLAAVGVIPLPFVAAWPASYLFGGFIVHSLIIELWTGEPMLGGI